VAPPPPPNGGNNTGPVHVTFGAVFPLSGVGCEEGWHALFGAMKARDVINCESPGGFPPVHLTDADAKKVGVKYMGSSCSHNLNLKMLVRDDKKLATNALYGVDQMLHQGVDALVGPMDSHVAKLVALFAQYEQVPVVSYRAAMAKLTNESMTTLTNFMRVYPSEEIIAKGIIDFIAEYKWEGVTFISTDDEYGYDAVRIFDKHMSTLKANMEKKGEQSLEYYETFTMDPTNAKSIEDKLNEIKETGWRVVVLMVAEENAVPILHQAARLRMLRLGWVWLGNEWATDEVYENYNVVASGKPDGGSTDGTGAYLAEELDGLVTFRVQEANTQPSIELEQAWNREKATYGNTTMCPGLSSQQKHLHKLGDFAFDAVMVAASGCEKAAGLRAADPTRMGHWWRNGRKSVSFGVSGRSMMYKQMNSAKLQSAATGAVGFTPQGDPDMAKIEISNWVGGKFKNVGSWVQAEADYAKCVQAAATGKQCGVLQIRQDDVTWMGGMQGGSPPDRANHLNHVHAEYMTLVAWLLIVSIVGGNLLELIHFHYMPEAGFTIIVGLLAGLIVKAYGYVTSSYHMEELARFDEKVFSLLLLPIIIFDAGFGAKKARFFMNLGPILITALIGTSISTLIVGFSLYFLEDVTNVHMGIPEALTFGAVISAVDPVATLAVFGALKVEHNLYYRVFGESLINDACAIVLFRVFQKFIVAEVTTISVLKGVWSFIVIFFGSIAAGVIIGMLASLTIKMAHIHDPLLAAGMFIICSYISYEASEVRKLISS
jgi:ABC-type branched-subunit amino acid transport system substrate-binding protein